MAAVSGSARSGSERVREAFAANFDTGEVGAAVAVTVDGELVVDLWGGHRDGAQDPAVEPRHDRQRVLDDQGHDGDLRRTGCAEKGALDLDAPVAAYWPEFAQAGKGQIPVRWLLCHKAGPRGDPQAAARRARCSTGSS